MEVRMARGEACLRVSAIVVLVLTACLVAFDTQTKVIILTIEKKATYKDLNALKILVYVTSAAAGYNVLQICNRFLSACSGGKGSCNIYMAWITLLLDQDCRYKRLRWVIMTGLAPFTTGFEMIVYITFGSNSAALEASLLAVKGAKALQWMKVCNRFTRFCVQIGGAVLCGYAACILMAMISTVSAYQLFRMYSPKRFLRLKSR